MQYDLNQDGYIDAGEIREAKPEVTHEELSGYFIRVDLDEDGRITYDEYIKPHL